MRGATFTLISDTVSSFSVSIHAPVRGATVGEKLVLGDPDGFNPRTREGCDAGSSQKIDQLIVSIHAPVRGVTSYWYFSNITI